MVRAKPSAQGVRDEIQKRLEVVAQLQETAETYQHLPHTLLDMLQAVWRQNDAARERSTGGQLLLPDGRRVSKGALKISWGEFLHALAQLKAYLQVMLPPQALNTRTWTMRLPSFTPPPKPLLCCSEVEELRKEIEETKVPPFVPPPRVLVEGKQPAAPKLLKVPEKPALELPHFGCVNVKGIEREVERRGREVEEELREVCRAEVEAQERWLEVLKEIDWSTYSFQGLLECPKQKKLLRKAEEELNLELAPLPVFVEPKWEEQEKTKCQRQEFQPPQLRPLPAPINARDIVLTKHEIEVWRRELLDKYMLGVLANEVADATRFKQVARLKIQCSSRWKPSDEFRFEEGREILFLPYMQDVRISTKITIQDSKQVQILSYSSGVELIMKEHGETEFVVHVRPIKQEEKGQQLVIFRWRVLSAGWINCKIFSPVEGGRWTPKQALVPIECSEFSAQIAFPRLRSCPSKRDQVQDVLNGDGIIAFAGLQLMKPYNPPFAVNDLVKYANYKVVLVLCITKKMKETRAIKELLLQLLHPRQEAIAQLFGNGGGLNVAVVGGGRARYFSDDAFVTPHPKTIERMRSWVRMQGLPHKGKRFCMRKDVDSVLKWATAKGGTAVHFLTADFNSEDFQSGNKGLPFHVLCFGSNPDRTEANMPFGTVNHIAIGPDVRALHNLFDLSEAAWSTDTSREAKANEAYRRQYVSQENALRFENRRALRQANARFQYLLKAASQVEESIINQDRLRCVIWQWHCISEIAHLRARTTVLNLFLAAATVRKKKITREKRFELEQARYEAATMASDCVVHILDTVLLDVFTKERSKYGQEAAKIKAENESLMLAAREEFNARVDPHLEALEHQRLRRAYEKKRDELFKEHLKLVESIKSKNVLAEKTNEEQCRKIKFDLAIPEIHQLLSALRHKHQVVQCLSHKFRILGCSKTADLRPPGNRTQVLSFLPIHSHERHRKSLTSIKLLQLQALEREVAARKGTVDTQVATSTARFSKSLRSDREQQVSKIQAECHSKVDLFVAAVAKAKQAIICKTSEIFEEHGKIAAVGWKLAPYLPYLRKLKGAHHIDSARRRCDKAVSMMKLLKRIGELVAHYRSDAVPDLGVGEVPPCLAKDDFKVPVNRAAFQILLAKASDSAFSAVKASTILESADSAAFALAESEREKLALDAWYEVEVFPLTFENKSRLFVYELTLAKAFEGREVEHEEAVAKAKRIHEETIAAIERRNEERLISCKKKEEEARRLAEEKYKAVLVKARTDFEHEVIRPIQSFNADIATVQKRADAAGKELALVQRFENELRHSVPKTKLARKIAECTVREALQRAFKPHLAGAAMHVANSRDLRKVSGFA